MSKISMVYWFLVIFAANCFNCKQPELRAEEQQEDVVVVPEPAKIGFPAAYHPAVYTDSLAGKKLALVVNQTSEVRGTHLVDTLIGLGHEVVKIFAPEHGFRGGADAGAVVADGADPTTGLPIKSLYGKSKKPSRADLEGVDLVVFDIQDVGARFYTYISTLHYVMESAARYGVPVLVLDRPNPNGGYVDGPLRKEGYASFVGLDPIPVVHGLTVGEYARMVNGEGWLGEGLRCELTVVPCQEEYDHAAAYELPVAPSPNLPNQRSVYLYPSLCFFEGTSVSVGRGTDRPFQVYGHPQLLEGPATFTPVSGPGAKYPKLENVECRGFDFTAVDPAVFFREGELNLSYLLEAHTSLASRGEEFFTRPDFFDLLAGSDRLRKDIMAGKTEAEIRAGWSEELAGYRGLRERYRLYPD